MLTAFNVGKDMQLLISIPVLSTGTNVSLDVDDLGLLESFSAKPSMSEITVKPINNGGVEVHRPIVSSYNGSFDIVPTGPTSYYLQQILHESYYKGQGILATITQLIFPPDGSAAIAYSFANAVLKADDAGTFAGEQKVTHVYSFLSPTRDLLTTSLPTKNATDAAFLSLLAALNV